MIAAWNHFFHRSRPSQVCDGIRIGFAALLLINLSVLGLDLVRWFGESGALPYAASRQIIDPDTLTLFTLLPKQDLTAVIAYGLLVGHTIALGLGFFSRINAAGVFVWFVSFSHRNHIIFDSEDYVFRLFAFFLIWMPIGRYWAIDAWRHRRRDPAFTPPPAPPWPLRLMQIQMTLIYVSTAWEKLRGTDWVQGTALYYVSQLDDLFGKFPVPGLLFDPHQLGRFTTWSVLAIECLLPFALWIRPTRRAAICVGICLHLSIEYAMNLFLFQWIMILGLLSFTTPEDWHALAVRIRRISARLGSPNQRA